MTGTNGNGNSSIEFRNAANCGTIIINSENPSSARPGLWIDINPSTKVITLYANTGSGDVKIGTVAITPA